MSTVNLSSLNSLIFNTIGKHYISYKDGVLSQDEFDEILGVGLAEKPVIAPNQVFIAKAMYRPVIAKNQVFTAKAMYKPIIVKNQVFIAEKVNVEDVILDATYTYEEPENSNSCDNSVDLIPPEGITEVQLKWGRIAANSSSEKEFVSYTVSAQHHNELHNPETSHPLLLVIRMVGYEDTVVGTIESTDGGNFKYVLSNPNPQPFVKTE